MKNKDKLRKLVELVEDLLKLEGNEWLIDEFLQMIGKVSHIEDMARHSVIQNIHEYCVERKIEKQAEDFYSSFPITEIKDRLIQDYKKMEHERRRDDFENFCLCVFQQIENITNFLFDNEIKGVWEAEKGKIAVKSAFDEEKRKHIAPKSGGTTVQQLVFQTSNYPTWYVNRKFRAVMFFFYYKAEVKGSMFQFNLICSTHDEIYQMRNQNHRGNKPSDYQQSLMDKIAGNEAKYYFKFYGFLQDFVSKIELSYNEVIIDTRRCRKKSGEKIKSV